MSGQPYLRLNDGVTMPQLGFGVWKIRNDEAADVVAMALAAGYRSIDTAAIYGNEEGVGAALARTDVPREELFVTTKLWNERQGYDETLRAFDESLARLGLDHVDLYLIHWPCPARDRYLDTWRAFIRLKEEGRVRSIGVSNFKPAHLRRLIDATGVVPSVNQVELHPRWQQKELRDVHARLGIATEAWSPLGMGRLLQERTLADLARKHGRSPAQVILRWHLESGLIAIPKSSNAARIRENFQVFDFRLDAEDMAAIAALDGDGRIGADPDNFN